MKRYFVETNADNMVAFVDDNNRVYFFNEQAFDEPLTLDVAKTADYSNCEGCETAEEIAHSVGVGEVYDWNEDDYLIDGQMNVSGTEMPKATEF